MTDLPTHLHYTLEHEWLQDGTPATVGITSTAAEALGDIVYLELPAVGETITAGAVVGEIESTKSVSELFSPVSGTVGSTRPSMTPRGVRDRSITTPRPSLGVWIVAVE